MNWKRNSSSDFTGKFTGGRNLTEALAKVRSLNQSGIGAILDYCSFRPRSGHPFDLVTHEVQRIKKSSVSLPGPRGFVLKLSRLIPLNLHGNKMPDNFSGKSGKGFFTEFFGEIEFITVTLADAGVEVIIDHDDELSMDTRMTIYHFLAEKFNFKLPTVYFTVQVQNSEGLTLLNRILTDEIITGKYAGIVLVKGYQSGQGSNNNGRRNFRAAIDLCLDRIHNVGLNIATHDEDIIQYGINRIKKSKIKPSDSFVQFSQALGIKDSLTLRIAGDGFNVCKYVPYGDYRYLIPSLAEMLRKNRKIQNYFAGELKNKFAELKG